MSETSKRLERLRERIYLVISPHRGSSERDLQKLSRCFDWFIATLILISSSLAFVSTFDISEENKRFLTHVENVILWIFTFEYLLRVWTADLYFKADKRKRRCERLRRTWKFIWTPLAIVDLIAILPLWVPFPVVGNQNVFMALRFFKVARLLRYAKRYGVVFDNIASVLKEQRRELKVSLIAIGALIMVASILMFAAEHDAQPEKFTNAFSGLWWAVTTITTLGYGDLTPITPLGRFCGAIITFAGVAAIAVPTAIINSGFVKKNLTAEDLKQILSEEDKRQNDRLDRQQKMIDDLKRRFVDFENLLSGKDAAQDRALEEHGRTIGELTKRFADFTNLQMETDRKQNEVLEQQRQRMCQFEDAANAKLGELEKILLESRQIGHADALALHNQEMVQLAELLKERFSEFESHHRQGIDNFSIATKKQLDGLAGTLSDDRSREHSETLRMHKEGLGELSTAMQGRLDSMENKVVDLQQIIERYFMPVEKPDGALKKSARRMVSWLTPWKNKGGK